MVMETSQKRDSISINMTKSVDHFTIKVMVAMKIISRAIRDVTMFVCNMAAKLKRNNTHCRAVTLNT